MAKRDGTFIKAETYLRHLDPQFLRYYYASKLGPRLDDLDLNGKIGVYEMKFRDRNAEGGTRRIRRLIEAHSIFLLVRECPPQHLLSIDSDSARE